MSPYFATIRFPGHKKTNKRWTDNICQCPDPQRHPWTYGSLTKNDAAQAMIFLVIKIFFKFCFNGNKAFQNSVSIVFVKTTGNKLFI